MKRRLVKGLLGVALVLIALELVARFYFGLGRLPVYVEHERYEYMFAPNQDVWRFGNHVLTNEFGMRSASPLASDSIRILKFGDSVINGGAHIDQDSLSSTLLEKQLSDDFGKPVRVLNISAQSWGPDNAFAFLQEHGDFNTDLIILVFSSHDLHDNMHHQKVVGEKRAWPSKQPLCALTDAWSRYAWPWMQRKMGMETDEYDYFLGFDDSKVNPGWEQFIRYSKEKNIPLIVYLHPEQSELKSKTYNKYGIEILNLLQKDTVSVIKGIETIRDRSCYRDNVHLNEKGHRKLAEALLPGVRSYFNH
ncbi:MAG TPA: hypothetical protein PK637_04560 [Flavobacteriales bacterium]|mgnify:CR=1 FL=1|nr:hypothetical protein [Flavobacteriales bacterium]HRE96014.1 hypothetical protein [Flavobacteriales bacterium]HRJ36890.1 hypothetical protein [Flavobacteriales bacterium]HRJ39592.1 hypothetical protein [Flavobacteriales bacterium]